MLTVTELLTPLTKEQVKQKLYDLAAVLGLPTTSWLAGAVTRTLIAALAELFGTFIAPLLVTIAKSGFLDDAETDWLTLRAKTYFNVTRRVATFATGDITLDNAGGGIFTFEIGEAVFKNSTTDATYVNTEPFTLGALVTGLAVAVRAQDIGSAGNATTGQIDTLVTAMTAVTVTNAADLVGEDEESDEALRARCRDALGALSPDGAAAAYRYVVLTPALNGGANINRAKVLPAAGDITVDVIVASPTGTVSVPDVALAQAGIDEWATPDTVEATVSSATGAPMTLDVTAHVNSKAGYTSAEWEDAIKAALVAYVSGIDIGGLVLPPATSGVVPWRALVGVVERTRNAATDPYWVLNASLADESDFALTDLQVATLTTGAITVTVVQVTQATP